jgi:hypothetical protein
MPYSSCAGFVLHDGPTAAVIGEVDSRLRNDQGHPVSFDPRGAVKRVVAVLREYRSSVIGDPSAAAA